MKVIDKFTINPRHRVPASFTPAPHSFKTQISDCGRFKVSEKELIVVPIPSEVYALSMERVQNEHPRLFLRQPGFRLAVRNLEQACKLHRELVAKMRAEGKPTGRPLRIED